MKYEKVSIDTLLNDETNVREHNDRNLSAIKASLEKFGQQKPIVVDGEGVVVAGNGTLEAARQLGWKNIEVVRTKLKGADAVAYAIADNRTAELAVWNEEKLAKALETLQADESINELVTGFSPVDLEQLSVPFEKTNWEDEWLDMPEFTTEDKQAYRSIMVHTKDEKAWGKFVKQLGISVSNKAKYLWFPEIEIAHHADKRYSAMEQDSA
jgi:hypothetical protein